MMAATRRAIASPAVIPRRLDGEQVDQPGRAVRAGLLDDEVAERLARSLKLGPDAGIVRLEILVADPRQVGAH